MKNRGNVSVGTKAWAAKINAALQRTVDGFLEAGRLLIETKETVPAGDFHRMIERELRCDARTAQRLMAVAADARIATHASQLPASWTTLYELTKLDDDAFANAIDTGALTPKTQRKDVPRLRAPDAQTVTDADYETVESPDALSPSAPDSPPTGAFAREGAEGMPGGTSMSEPPLDRLDVAAAPLPAAGDDPDEAGNVAGQSLSEEGMASAAQDGECAGADARTTPSAGGEIELAPATGTSGDLVTLTRAEYEQLVKRAEASPWLVIGRPVSAIEYAYSLLRGAIEKVTPEQAAEQYRAAMFADDLTKIHDWGLSFEDCFRSVHQSGTAAALEEDAA